MVAGPWVHEGIPFHRWLSWRAAWLLIHLTLGMLLRVRVIGRDRIPERGGAMLLSNHTNFWDFLICFYGIYRPLHGIGTEQAFRVPVGGFLLKQLNGIPYSKGRKDRAAVQALADAYQGGGIIGMFPEGLRSWTGETRPVLPGTGRLVKSLGCPVIFGRVTTGFLQHPRWARWPRFVPWIMEYSAPQTFPADATVDEINAALEDGIRIHPAEVALPPGSWGIRLAEGLPRFLWGCPDCGARESLSVPPADRDTIGCAACGRRWRLDLLCIMHGETPNADTMSVADAHRRLLAVAQTDTALTAETAHITEVRRGQHKRVPVAAGAARMEEAALQILTDGAVAWSLPYDDITAVLLQFGNRLQIRAGDANYQLDLHGQNPLMWHHFLSLRAASAASQ